MPENPMIGSYEYYERLYEVEGAHWWSKGMRDIAAGILDAQYDRRGRVSVLDAGCGTGITLSWLERYSSADRIIGIDLSLHALQFCRRRGHRQLLQSSVLELPFADNSFDLVVCNDVLQHLPGKGADTTALGEFFRVLKPRGCLLVRTNSSWGMGGGALAESDDYRRYSPEVLRERAERVGFRVVKATYANSVMSLVPAIKRRLRRGTGPRRRGAHDRHEDHGLAIRLLPPSLRWLNAALYWLMRGEAWFLSKPSRTLGFGHSIFFLAQTPAPDPPSPVLRAR